MDDDVTLPNWVRFQRYLRFCVYHNNYATISILNYTPSHFFVHYPKIFEIFWKKNIAEKRKNSHVKKFQDFLAFFWGFSVKHFWKKKLLKNERSHVKIENEYELIDYETGRAPKRKLKYSKNTILIRGGSYSPPPCNLKNVKKCL